MPFNNNINKRKASLFGIVLVALLIVIKHDYLSAETPKPTLSDRPLTTSTQTEIEPQKSNEVAPKSERQVFESLEQAMIRPQNIPIPPGIPTYKMIGDTIEFTKHEFEKHYLEDWNKCLFVIANSKDSLQDIEMPSTGDSFKHRELLSAQIVKGFEDCQKRCVDLSKNNDISSIRRVAKELHREIHDGLLWISR